MTASSPRLASYSCERRPRLLKDFLTDDSVPSCSSNKTSSNTQLIRRSRSKATSVSISAIHKASEMVINAIKFLPFNSMVKSHSILPRSISRKLSRSRGDHNQKTTTVTDPVFSGDVSLSPAVTPKIKDILRWKSFRDVVEEISTNWYERDFAADQEDLYSWGGQNNNTKDFMDRKKMEGQFAFDDEDEQHSPVSILDDYPFRNDEGSISFFSPSVATILERRKCLLMQRIQEFETLDKQEKNFNQTEEFALDEKSTAKEDEETDAVEAKARQLLSQVKATAKKCGLADEDHLLLDFFRHELAITNSKMQKDVQSADSEMLILAESWINRECCEGTFDWELLEKTEACIRDMETGLRWNKFDEEQQELGLELEIHVLNDLFDELLADLII